MKKTRSIALITLFALFFAIVLSFSGLGSSSASADYRYDYDDEYFDEELIDKLRFGFYFENYNVTYNIESNREISVCEDLTVTFTGYESTGFIKDIPVNGGELVRGVEVFELIGGEVKSVVYHVYSRLGDNLESFFCIDIGNSSNKTDQTRTYRIKYRYCLAKAQEGKNKISLNLIGTGRASYCNIVNAEINVLVPEGYIGGEFYQDILGGNKRVNFAQSERNGKVMLSLSNIALAGDEGVTANLNFKDGSLSLYWEFTPYVFVIIAALLLLIAIVCWVMASNKNILTPVVNFEAPDKMDPLMMGKLIDNIIDNEDITSMIFYWADKGYLKIDLTDENDPMLIRITQRLPQGTPDYEATLFDGLFKNSDMVKTSSLQNRFYTAVDRATGMVNSKTKNLYENSSLLTAFGFAVVAGFILGLAPFIIGITSISPKFMILAPFVAIIPAIVINALCQGFKIGSFKRNKQTTIILGVVITVICLVFSALYVFLVPSFIMTSLPKSILVVLCCALSIVSAFLINRSKEYTEKLNNIVGFKEFIRVAEKDQLEKMIESNPQFYYHVLPYAQVLGVSDKWEEKFADITIPPPYWCTNSYAYFEFYAFNAIMHRSMAGMRSHMYSRPSSSGSGGHGGFGGGHVGGGHGGGGFRGR